MPFTGTKPKGQPRTLRTIAETKGSKPAQREDNSGYDMEAGIPMSVPGGGQRYEDEAAGKRMQPGGGQTGGPKPFK